MATLVGNLLSVTKLKFPTRSDGITPSTGQLPSLATVPETSERSGAVIFRFTAAPGSNPAQFRIT